MILNIDMIIVFVSIVASAECEQVPQWQELECGVKIGPILIMISSAILH